MRRDGDVLLAFEGRSYYVDPDKGLIHMAGDYTRANQYFSTEERRALYERARKVRSVNE